MSSFFLLKWGVQILCLFGQNQTPRSDSANLEPSEPIFCPQILEPRCPVSTVPPAGSATACINEGFSSVIDWRGNQPERNNTVSRRTDGDAYAALGIAMAGAVEKNQTRLDIGTAMIDYIFFWSGCQQRLQAGASGAEAADGSKGLVAWFPGSSASCPLCRCGCVLLPFSGYFVFADRVAYCVRMARQCEECRHSD